MQKQFTAQKAIVLNGNDEILLIREKQTNARPEITVGKLCLPGGKIDFGETPDEALIREVQEETGVMCKPGLPIDIIHWQYTHDGDEIQINAVVRMCNYVSGSAVQKDNEVNSKIDFVGWIKITDIEIDDINVIERPGVTFFIENREKVLNLSNSSS